MIGTILGDIIGIRHFIHRYFCKVPTKSPNSKNGKNAEKAETRKTPL
jgi:hypothetical protein